jgi:hypothetical protein
MQPKAVKEVVRASRGIEGWFSPEAAALFAIVDEAQKAAGVSGDLFEIGAHHGLSAVMLGRMAAAGERVGVCDLFDSQDQNLSISGQGDRAIFVKSMKTVAPGVETTIFEKLSGDLTADEIGGPYRFFHVDGGHLAEEALQDMRLGAQVLDARGVIVVDDPWRIEWPGVTEAILEFLSAGAFEPIVLGFNKLVLAPAEAREMYTQFLTPERAWSYIDHRVFEVKTLPIAGTPTLIFYIPTYRQIERAQPIIAKAKTVTTRGLARLRR